MARGIRKSTIIRTLSGDLLGRPWGDLVPGYSFRSVSRSLPVPPRISFRFLRPPFPQTIPIRGTLMLEYDLSCPGAILTSCYVLSLPKHADERTSKTRSQATAHPLVRPSPGVRASCTLVTVQ